MDNLKKAAGLASVENVANDMLLGLGTGSTVYYAIEEIARKIKEESLDITAVSTSFSTTLLCNNWNIPVIDSGSVSYLDLAIDGADEVDSNLNLIKGRGAAHTFEKIVAKCAKEFVVVADDSKIVDVLGSKMPVPVEFSPKALELVKKELMDLGAQKVHLRMGSPGKDGPIISDSGNFIFDAEFESISNASKLEASINNIPGVLDNGIFAGITQKAIIASSDGIRIMQ